MHSVMYSSKSEDWETPQSFFDELDKEFHFDLDVASSDQNAKCNDHFTVNDSGLDHSWAGHTVWCNPPYGRKIADWVRKAFEESKNCVVVMLLPARTDTKWFHDYCVFGEIRFVRGRFKFGNSNNYAPFPSMVVVFGKETVKGGYDEKSIVCCSCSGAGCKYRV